MSETGDKRAFRRAVGFTSAVCALALTLSGCGSDSKKSDNEQSALGDAPSFAFVDRKATGSPVKVGLLNPQGSSAANFPEGGVAAQAVVDYANDHLDGLAGHEIELVTCDLHAEDPSSYTVCANEMVREQVVGVVVTSPGNGQLMAPIITQAGIAYTSYSGNSQIEATLPNAFLWVGGVPATAVAVARHAAGAGITNVTTFVVGVGDIPEALRTQGTPLFAAMGIDLEVVAISPTTPDVTAQVQSGLKDKPGAVAVVGDAATCTSVLKALKTVGSTATRYLVQQCTDPAVFKAVPDMVDGSLLFTTVDVTSDSYEARVYRAVMAKYAPEDANIGGNAPNAYQAMFAFVRTVSMGLGKQDVTPENVIAAIKSAGSVPLPAGNGITMKCDGSALPPMPNACTAGNLVGEIEGDVVKSFSVVK